MDITPLGHASFRIRGKTAAVVTDPFDPAMVGLKFPKHTTADIVTVSHGHHDHNNTGSVEGGAFVVSGPGEYEIKGISIIGIGAFHDEKEGSERGLNTMYRMEIDGVTVVHLGDLGHALSAAIVDELDGVDILMVPVGGVYTIGPQEAVKVIKEIDPSIVIPMHYFRPELNKKTFSALSPVSDFLKEMGKDATEPIAKLSVTKDKIAPELQVIVLE